MKNVDGDVREGIRMRRRLWMIMSRVWKIIQGREAGCVGVRNVVHGVGDGVMNCVGM